MNRTRSKSFTIRLNQDEHQRIMDKISHSKISSQREFFLSMLNKKPIIVIDGLTEVVTELKRQGTNLNQIAKVLNESGQLEDYEKVKKVMNECWSIYGNLKDIATEVRNAHL